MTQWIEQNINSYINTSEEEKYMFIVPNMSCSLATLKNDEVINSKTKSIKDL